MFRVFVWIFSVPSEFHDAILLAVTPTKHCVGIKIFNESCLSDQNGNLDDDFEAFIDRCIRDAIQMKREIEVGMHDIENDPKIVINPSSDLIDTEKLLELRAKGKNRFIAASFLCVGISFFGMMIFNIFILHIL